MSTLPGPPSRPSPPCPPPPSHPPPRGFRPPAALPPIAPLAPLPLAPTTPWMLADDGIPHRFPLHAAHAAALDPASYGSDDQERVSDFLERHPQAYLGWAWGAHSEDARGTRYESW